SQFAGFRVDLGMDVGFAAVTRAGGLCDCILHRGDDDYSVDRLLACYRIGDLQQLEPVGADSHRSISLMMGAMPVLAGCALKSFRIAPTIRLFGAHLAALERRSDQRLGEHQ